MKKSLLYFSILILVSNFLFFGVGIIADIGFVGGFMGGLMAIGTDPIIIVMAILIGTVLVNLQSRFIVIYFILASIVGATVVHYILGTTIFLVDVIRVDVLLIIPSIIIVAASFFGSKIKITNKKSKIKKMIKPPKRLWIALPIIAVISLIFYGVVNYESKVVEDDPRWMVCEPNRTFWKTPKSKYIKFHNTIKVDYDFNKMKWVKHKNVKEVVPTIEIHEDKTRFYHAVFGYRKILPIYVSDKYYVFYKEINDGWFWGGEIKTSGQHMILNRSNLTLLEYNTQKWIKGLGMSKKYNDEVIDELFRDINEYPKDMYYNLSKKTEKLFTFQCEETEAIKPKI
jgi:hypothetical protein